MNKLSLSFDDVLVIPKFSSIRSRKDVDVKVSFLGQEIFPVISSNMDSVTTSEMANAMNAYGALGALHRFQSIEDNVKMYKASAETTICSIGLGKLELERAEALYDAGCMQLLVDVANGANVAVVEQIKQLKALIGDNFYLIVGNFATAQNIKDFKYHSNEHVDAWKAGIGGGSGCLTRKVTGCGLPTLASIIDCSTLKEPIIADGGIRGSDDFAKALAAGATCVMLGGMLAGSEEAPGNLVDENGFKVSFNKDGFVTKLLKNGEKIQTFAENIKFHKKYRGSASQESYEAQGKVSEWRTAEGDSFLVPYSGPVKNTLQKLDAGLRSAMSYVGANDLEEFQENADLAQVTSNGAAESFAHGKKS